MARINKFFIKILVFINLYVQKIKLINSRIKKLNNYSFIVPIGSLSITNFKISLFKVGNLRFSI